MQRRIPYLARTLLQFRALPACFRQQLEIRIGVLPAIEEAIVRLSRAVCVACRRQRPSEADERQRFEAGSRERCWMINQAPEFHCRFSRLSGLHQRPAAQKDDVTPSAFKRIRTRKSFQRWRRLLL